MMNLMNEKDAVLHEKVQELLYSIYGEHNSIGGTAERSMYGSILQILTMNGKAYSKSDFRRDGAGLEQKTQAGSFQVIYDYINVHYAEKVTLEEAAKICGYSKYHFGRLFKKFTKQTFYQYLNKIRIRNAVLLLKDYDMPITEVAYKSGFTTISSFIRMFRIYHNCTPTEFRNRMFNISVNML